MMVTCAATNCKQRFSLLRHGGLFSLLFNRVQCGSEHVLYYYCLGDLAVVAESMEWKEGIPLTE